MKVKITKASKPTYWYANKIGRKYTVVQSRTNPSDFLTKAAVIYGSRGAIDKSDCEVVQP